MATVEYSIAIQVPVTKVFREATDYDNMQRWQPDLVSVNVTAGSPLRAGSIISMQRRFQTSDIFVNADVIDMQRNKRFEMRGVHGRFRFSRVIEFQPGGGETIIRDTINIKTGFIFFWYAPLLTGNLKRQISKEWEALKDLLESA